MKMKFEETGIITRRISLVFYTRLSNPEKYLSETSSTRQQNKNRLHSLYSLASSVVPLTIPPGRICRCLFLMNICIFLAVAKLVLLSLRATAASSSAGGGDPSWRANWGAGAVLTRPHIVAASSPRNSAFTMTGT